MIKKYKKIDIISYWTHGINFLNILFIYIKKTFPCFCNVRNIFFMTCSYKSAEKHQETKSAHQPYPKSFNHLHNIQLLR